MSNRACLESQLLLGFLPPLSIMLQNTVEITLTPLGDHFGDLRVFSISLHFKSNLAEVLLKGNKDSPIPYTLRTSVYA